MAGLQRSTTSFRRQGSSGLVWDDRLLAGEDSQQQQQSQDQKPKTASDNQQEQGELGINNSTAGGLRPIRTVGPQIERSRSNGGGGGRRHRIGRVSPAMDPPSPRLSACGCCSAFGNNKPPTAKKINNNNKDPMKRTGKRKSR